VWIGLDWIVDAISTAQSMREVVELGQWLEVYMRLVKNVKEYGT